MHVIVNVYMEGQWAVSLRGISEEVCWLQQEEDLSANNSDDRNTADLCSWKTIWLIQLSVAKFNYTLLSRHIEILCGCAIVSHQTFLWS